MRNLFVLVTAIFLFSCELHQQTSVTQGERVRAEVNLSVIATLSKGISENDLALIESTLNSGNYDINVVDEKGELLIIKAVGLSRFPITKLLLDFGADPAAVDGEGRSAKEIVSGNPDESEWLALFEGLKLSPAFATKNLFDILSETNQTNVLRQLPLVKSYIILGAEINGQNRSQYTPLMIAASNGVLEVVNFLCTVDGIDPNIVGERGRGRRKQEFTAMSLATQAGHSAVVDALVACGAVK